MAMHTLANTRSSGAKQMVVATVPPQVPVLDASDLPYEEDWAVMESLGVDADVGGYDHELQYDRYGTLTLAPAAFD